MFTLSSHTGGAFGVAFSPAGSLVGSSSFDGWAMQLAALVEIARSGVTRTLTDDEGRQHLHVPR